VGPSLLAYAQLGSGRRLHIVDCTKVEAPLESGHYECSGKVKNDDGSWSRGYKLATLRTLLDTAKIVSEAAVAPIQDHDIEVCQHYIVLVTNDQELTAKYMVKHYEERPEIEQEYEQMKSGGWKLQKLPTTRYSGIVFYLLSVLLSYSLYHLFSNTQAGSHFADKTRQAIAPEQLCTHRTHVIVYAGGYFEIFETLSFVHLVLGLPPPVQARLRQ
jgi:hypothetical protein